MSNAYNMNQQATYDYLPSEDVSLSSSYDSDKAYKITSSETVRSTHISEELWENTKKRHCDARQNMRTLLDRYIRPHS